MIFEERDNEIALLMLPNRNGLVEKAEVEQFLNQEPTPLFAATSETLRHYQGDPAVLFVVGRPRHAPHEQAKGLK